MLGTYHLAFASSSVSNALVFFPEDDDDDDAEPRLLVLLFLRNAHEKYTVAAKNAKTTAFPSIAPGGFRALIASRPSLNNAILDCTFERQKCDAPETKRYKDVLLLRLLEYALSLFLSEEEDESGESLRLVVLRAAFDRP